MTEGPMRAGSDDYESIIELGDECFPRDRELGGMLPRWGHCFRKDKIQNSLIMKEGSRVVSHLGCIDQTVMIDESEIRVAGISSVCTRPSHRHRGLMTKLLLYSIGFMKEKGYVISDLGGDRLRYGRFGWERAGRAWRFRLTPRSVAGREAPSDLEVGEFTGSANEMEATLQLHNSSGFGLTRDLELHAILLNRLGKETFVARRNGVVDSYAVVVREDEKRPGIDELAGTPDGVRSILLHLLKARGSESVSVPMPWNHPLDDEIRSLSSGWTIDSWRMIKILDLAKTLQCFSGQLGSRYRRMGFKENRKVILGIDGNETAAELDFSEDGVVVGKTGNLRGAIVLPERRMVTMLFASMFSSLNLPQDTGFLEALLPLDFYIWGNEAV